MRFLVLVVIGIPGALIWGLGLLALVTMGNIALTENVPVTPEAFIALGITVGFSLIGFGMVMTVEILTTGKRYRFEPRRLPLCIALELAVQTSGTIGTSLVIATLVKADGKDSLFLFFGAMAVIFMGGTRVLYRNANRQRMQWKEEYVLLHERPGD